MAHLPLANGMPTFIWECCRPRIPGLAKGGSDPQYLDPSALALLGALRTLWLLILRLEIRLVIYQAVLKEANNERFLSNHETRRQEFYKSQLFAKQPVVASACQTSPVRGSMSPTVWLTTSIFSPHKHSRLQLAGAQFQDFGCRTLLPSILACGVVPQTSRYQLHMRKSNVRLKAGAAPLRVKPRKKALFFLRERKRAAGQSGLVDCVCVTSGGLPALFRPPCHRLSVVG